MDPAQQNILLLIAIIITLFYFYQGWIFYFVNSVTSAAVGTIPKWDFIYV